MEFVLFSTIGMRNIWWNEKCLTIKKNIKSPHNVLFKLFASKKKENIRATKKVKTDLYSTFPLYLKCFITDFIHQCLLKGGNNMDWLNLTPKDMKTLKRDWLKTIHEKYTASE
ncbi:hypothetical protein MHK_002359 [Candidatus Magnetomorum sp. HK-1]|nr:hypothetical protein MHK_002359 [Candidatus Magnetomorum sp. HK-1]